MVDDVAYGGVHGQRRTGEGAVRKAGRGAVERDVHVVADCATGPCHRVGDERDAVGTLGAEDKCDRRGMNVHEVGDE